MLNYKNTSDEFNFLIASEKGNLKYVIYATSKYWWTSVSF
jgi:hypothetical protein